MNSHDKITGKSQVFIPLKDLKRPAVVFVRFQLPQHMLEKVLDNTPKVNLDPRDAGLSLDRACSGTDGYVADKLSIYIYILYIYIII